MSLLETIAATVNDPNVAYTAEELAALTYQLQGSYDNKPVEILSKDLYSIKSFAAYQGKTVIPFFDDSGDDVTVSNVKANQLPANESHTVHEILIRGLFKVGEGDSLAAAIEEFTELVRGAAFACGVTNKTPWVEFHCARLFAPTAGAQVANTTLADTASASVVAGSVAVVDAIYRLSIPKVIGEKVSFKAALTFADAIPASGPLEDTEAKIYVGLGGINVHGR